MNDSNEDDLDRQIRRLISEAGGEAPVASDQLPTVKVSPDMAGTTGMVRKGVLVGTLSLAAVLAVVAVVVIREPDAAPPLETVVPTSGVSETVASTAPSTTRSVDTTVAATTTTGGSTPVVDVPGRDRCTTTRQLPGLGDLYSDELSCFDANFGGSLVVDAGSLWRAGDPSGGGRNSSTPMHL